MEKYTVSQVSGLSGVSVRTLHYYDDIGLLKPAETTDAGYRLYSGSELSRLQEILFLRELDFDLKEIGAVMSMPQHDGQKALSRQKAMLLAKIERLNRLISLIDNRMKGEDQVNFSAFDMKKMEEHKAKYKREAEQRWGTSAAYKESIKRTEAYGPEDWTVITEEAKQLYQKFAGLMAAQPPDGAEAHALAKQWQEHITKYYYPCSNEILAGLGEMYAGDERFRSNIDQYAEGLAEYMSKAISAYCQSAG